MLFFSHSLSLSIGREQSNPFAPRCQLPSSEHVAAAAEGEEDEGEGEEQQEDDSNSKASEQRRRQ